MKTWRVNVDGMEKEISWKQGFASGTLTVDGQSQKLKSQSYWVQMNDQMFQIGSKTYHFVRIGRKMDLAEDGVYLDSKEPYVPLKNMPSWAWIIFIVLTITGILFGGWPGLFVGLLGGQVALNKSISPKETNPMPMCIGIAVACFVGQIVIGVILFFLRY